MYEITTTTQEVTSIAQRHQRSKIIQSGLTESGTGWQEQKKSTVPQQE